MSRIKNLIRRWLNVDSSIARYGADNCLQKSNGLYVTAVKMLIDEGRTVEMPVRGWSMRIFVEHERDKAILAPCHPDDLKVGDVVLARIDAAEESYVLHRIIRRDGDRLTLMGDGNLRGTETTTIDRVIAIATGFVRGNKKHPDLVTSRKWRIYSYLWMRLLPLRRWLILTWRVLRKLHILKR